MKSFLYRLLFAVLVLCAVPLIPAAAAEQSITVGVVEFEEKNSIGLENSGRIVAEWVVTELKNIGKFQIQERLLVNKILEEQNLVLSGVIDSKQAVEIGQLYGVDALVTGAVMKVGSSISVTGRMINVQNGEVLKSASITTESLSELQTEIIVLANALCDISRTQWEVETDIARRQIGRLEIGAGIGYVFDNVDWSGMAISTFLRYRDSWGQVWFDATPVGGIKSIELGGALQVSPFLGIAADYGMVFDTLVDYASSSYLNFGVVASPRTNIELAILLGGALTGSIWTEDNNEIDGLDPYWKIPSNYNVWASYQFSDDLLLFVKYTGTEIGDFEEKIPTNYWHPFVDYEFLTGRFTISGLYSFAIE